MFSYISSLMPIMMDMALLATSGCKTECVHVACPLGKARVAPLKQMTVPCMDLRAAVLVVRVERMRLAELQYCQLKLKRSVYLDRQPVSPQIYQK